MTAISAADAAEAVRNFRWFNVTVHIARPHNVYEPVTGTAPVTDNDLTKLALGVGLAVTKSGAIASHPWCVTHVPSGYKVGPFFATRTNARACLLLLLPLTDWNRPRDRVFTGADNIPQTIRRTLVDNFGAYEGCV